MNGEVFKKLTSDELSWLEEALKAGTDQKEIAKHIDEVKDGIMNIPQRIDYLNTMLNFIDLYREYKKGDSK